MLDPVAVRSRRDGCHQRDHAVGTLDYEGRGPASGWRRVSGHLLLLVAVAAQIHDTPSRLHLRQPRTLGHLDLPAGRRHDLRLWQRQMGRLLRILADKAMLAGITVERGTSSTWPLHQLVGRLARGSTTRHRIPGERQRTPR
ncbi:hypothetical protein Misp04_35010 [Micromonospora sp. NBRC 101691]|nr:hypothetical protein Misp04_35010 [Micromonospora sp. NBRC 101691]